MTDTEDEIDVEVVLPEPVVIGEDMVWIPDPEALHHDSGIDEGVLAVQFKAGCLWYLEAETRQWVNAEKDGAKRAKGRLTPVN